MFGKAILFRLYIYGFHTLLLSPRSFLDAGVDS